MDIPFNKQSDQWVNEICKCMSEEKLSFGKAVDFLMAKRKAQQPVQLEDEPIEVVPEIPPTARVVCPKCKHGMTYEHYLQHWTDCSKT